MNFKFGFIDVLKIKIVGADVLDGPIPSQKDSLSGKDICGASRCRACSAVAPYIWLMQPSPINPNFYAAA